jgi:hypothetical protein
MENHQKATTTYVFSKNKNKNFKMSDQISPFLKKIWGSMLPQVCLLTTFLMVVYKNMN